MPPILNKWTCLGGWVQVWAGSGSKLFLFLRDRALAGDQGFHEPSLEAGASQHLQIERPGTN